MDKKIIIDNDYHLYNLTFLMALYYRCVFLIMNKQ